MYEKYISNDHSKKMKGSLYSLFKEKVSTEMQSKIVQMSTIIHIIELGRPMKDYVHYKDFLNFISIPKFPSSHWSINSGWVFLKHMDEVIRKDLGESIKNSNLFSLSLDEVTAVDTNSWICMNV